MARKTVKYNTSHDNIFQVFLIQGVPYDMIEDIS